jgi:MFS family permease
LWQIFIASLLAWGIGSGVVMAHQVSYAVDIGFSPETAATSFGVWGIAFMGGLSSGFIADLIKRKYAFALLTSLAITAMILLITASFDTALWKLYAYSILFGYGTGLNMPTFATITADIFHGKNFGRINAFANSLSFGLGGAIGPWLAGFIYDVSLTYHPAFYICIAAWITATLLMWRVSPD